MTNDERLIILAKKARDLLDELGKAISNGASAAQRDAIADALNSVLEEISDIGGWSWKL